MLKLTDQGAAPDRGRNLMSTIVVLATATGRRLVGDVHVGRSEKVLQRHEETRLQATSETDTETAGSLRLDNASQLQTSLTLTDPTENTNDHHRFAAIVQANLR